MTRVRLTLMAGALFAALAAPGPAAAETKKMVVAAPGIPPIFASVILYVAEKEGFFKKYGVNAEVRPFDTGTAASRAVISGDIEMSLSPSALLINQISNADANTVAIYGMTNSDFLLGSTDPAKTSCKDVVGQPVGVDTVGGARSIALRSMLTGGCPGVKIDDVQQVALSSNVRAGDDRRPAQFRRPASRRRRGARGAGQEGRQAADGAEDQSEQPLPRVRGARRQAQGEPRRLCPA